METRLKIGSDFSGVGSAIQALQRLNVNFEESFACDMDKYARQTYIYNFGNESDNKIIAHEDYKKVADIFHREFVELNLKRPTKEELSYAYAHCEFISRQFSFYYPWNVYNRKVPSESLDLFVTSPPCQSFSLAGKRKGEDSKNGVLFYNSHEFIQKNKPRFFIFENVKGLLSDSGGKTFQRWIDYLGGKSVNGNPAIFPHENSVPYHIYYKVLNAKHYGIPQNRERIFIIGIRDDGDNNFNWPKPFPLVKRLKDILESEIDEKYFLSDKMMEGLIKSGDKSFINQDTQASQVYSENGTSPNICAGTHGYANGYVETKIGAIRGRNPQNPLSRVSGLPTEQMLEINENGTSNALTTVQKDNVVVEFFNNKRLNETLKNVKLPNEIAIIDSYNQIINTEYCHTVSTRINASSCSHVLIPTNNSKGYDIATDEDSINFSNPNSETRRGRVGKGVAQTLDTGCNQGVFNHQRIRRLTPTEAFRLMDFNENFIEKTLNSKKNLYFQFVYSKFDINKKETLCNVKLKTVKDTQTPKNLETYVLCTTKECQKMDALTILKLKSVQKKEKKDKPLNVSFAIELLGEKELKECATNTIKWTDCTETLYTLMKEGKNQVVRDISEIQKDKSCIEKSLKITLEENLSEEKLFITLILLKQIMTSKIYTYVKMPLNTQRFISSIVVYEKKLERLSLSYLKMEYTEQIVSDSMLYKQAGNSICVGVLAAIIEKLNLK